MPLNSHDGDIGGSSDTIKINVIQNINLPNVITHKVILLGIHIIGVYIPQISKKWKTKSNNVINTGYDTPLYINYLISVAKKTCDNTPKVTKRVTHTKKQYCHIFFNNSM